MRVRPNFRIFATRRSISLTRSPYSVPGSIRFTVAVGALFDRLRPSDGAITELGAAQLAAQRVALVAAHRAGDLHVDLRDRVRARAP